MRYDFTKHGYIYILHGPLAVRGRGSCGEREERGERRMEKHWAGLKTQETHKWPREVTQFRNKKEPLITESLNE